MFLRKLQPEDAPLMLEWMHDDSVVHHLSTNFAAKTLMDCQRFIAASQDGSENWNLAIADDSGTYMGTVSLKHIDRTAQTAEFAITIRACAMGKGYSHYGMTEILRMGLEELGLTAIYWCVSPENKRAVRFYDKHSYARTTDIPQTILSAYPPELPLIWYVYPAK